MAGERKKRHTDQKGRNKTDPSYVEDITVYAKRLKISTDTPLKTPSDLKSQLVISIHENHISVNQP